MTTNQSNESTDSTQQPTLSPEEEKALYKAKKAAMFQAINRMKVDTTQSSTSFRNKSSMVSSFSLEQIDKFMKNPSTYQKQLRQLSNYLYDYSPEYRQIVDYISTLPKYAYKLKLLSIIHDDTDMEALQKAQLKVAQELDKMSLSHELAIAMRIAWKQDIFYGYEHENKNSFTIQNMDADYCRLSNLDYDRVFQYEFDFSYFDSNEDLLSGYPVEFHQKYQLYKDTKQRWIELNPDKAFAFKINEEVTSYPLLPFSVLFEPIFDLDEYKRLQKARAKMDNFMLLTQQIPLNDKAQGMDEFMISLETAMEFHNIAVAGLGSDGIGLLTSPMKIEAIKTEKSNKDKDTVAMALRGVFDASSFSQFLFNSDKNTSTGFAKSIIVDEQKLFKVYRQIERWLNRKVRKMSGKFKFEVKLLDITNFDVGKEFDSFLKAAQSGIPSVEEAAATIGISPLELHNKLMIENSPIGYQAKMKPLATSHTQSSKDSEGVGRSKVSDDEASDSTIINRDANTDENKII